MSSVSAPVLFLAFANEHEDRALYLRSLPEERRRLVALLDTEEAPYHVAQYPNLTPDELVSGLARYQNRIVLFHYGGHSDSYVLLLESAGGQTRVAHAGGLARLLAQQRGLHLVFLNGCANEEQVGALLDAGVAVVVATSVDIEDRVAVEFAAHFYRSLAANQSVADSFDQAVAATTLKHGSDEDHLSHNRQPATSHVPWALHYRDMSAIHWRLADAVDNPCWGLPAVPRSPLPPQPFRYLAWFRRQDAELFFGRCAEIRDLYERALAPAGAPIILLYGQSGVGKSSLLDAGLLPRLMADADAVYARHDPATDLVSSLCNLVGCETAQSTPGPAWLQRETDGGKPLVLILDQVEESLLSTRSALIPDSVNAPTTPSEQWAAFASVLTDLFVRAKQPPQGKLILGFRKEYLAEIESYLLAHNLPHAKVFVEQLGRRGIIEAITGMAQTPHLQRHYGLTVDGSLPGLIADDLLDDPLSPVAPTLQVLLTKLWHEAVLHNEARPRFDEALYRRLKREGLALQDFLNRQMMTVASRHAQETASGLMLDLLYHHTTPLGTAAQHGQSQIAAAYAHCNAVAIAELVQSCKDAYLLADPALDQVSSGGSRLAHDALAPLVRHQFERSDAPGQRARRILENRAVEWTDAKDGAVLDDADLRLVEAGEGGMRARTAQEERLLVASRVARSHRRRLRLALSVGVFVLMFAFLAVIGVNWLNEQAQNDRLLRQESQWLADLSGQQLAIDPVAALNLAWQASPRQEQPRPYLPDAEFALTQALRTSRERVYRQVAQAPLTAEQLALGKDQIAVGGDALRVVDYDLTQVLTLTQETGTRYAVRWDSTGELLLSRAANQVQVWRGDKQVASQAFDRAVGCAVWRPGTQDMAICVGSTIRLWSFTAQTLTPIYDAAQPILALHWSPDGGQLVAWTQGTRNLGQTLVIWDAQDGAIVGQLELALDAPVQSMAWSPDGGLAVMQLHNAPPRLLYTDGTQTPILLEEAGRVDGVRFVDEDRFVTWGEGEPVRLWSGNPSPRLLNVINVNADPVQDILDTPDGEHLLLLQLSGQAQQYDLAAEETPTIFDGHTRRIRTAAWSGDYLATGAIDGAVRIWAMTQSGRQTPLMTLYGHRGLSLGRADVLAVHWLPDKRLLSVGEDGSLRIWQVLDDEGQPVCNGVDMGGIPRCHAFSRTLFTIPAPFLSARWLDERTLLTVDADSTAQRVDLSTGEIVSLPDDSGVYPEVRWDAEGGRVFTFVPDYGDGVIRAFPDGAAVVVVPGPISNAFWLEPGLLVSHSAGAAQLLNPTTGDPIATLPDVDSPVTAAQEGSDGDIALATEDGSIYRWRPDSASAATRWEDHLSALAIHDLQWLPDGRHLLAVSNVVTLWDVNRSAAVWTTDPILSERQAALSLDAQFVAISAGSGVSVRSVRSGEIRWDNTSAHAESVRGVQWLIGETWPNQARLVPLVDGFAKFVAGETSQPFQRPVSQRLLLLSWGGDGVTKLWDWQTQSEIMRLTQAGAVSLAGVSPDGAQILTVTEEFGDTGLHSALRVWPSWQQTAITSLDFVSELLTR